MTTDMDQFLALRTSATAADWLEAMRLVRGVPLSDLRHADWAVLDGTLARIDRVVTDAALDWAEQLMRQHRPDDAEWVLRQALLASPYDERLYRAVLRATEAQGVRARLHITMAQLAKLAGDGMHPSVPVLDHELAGCARLLHPETTSLYHELLAYSPATG